MSLEDYDRRAHVEWPLRIPDTSSSDLSRRLGDCIYDYANGYPPRQRKGVHGPKNEKVDLGGRNVLISRDFYYFGSRAITLPKALQGIVHQSQGHRSNLNAAYFSAFESWVRGLNLEPGQLYGWPDHIVDWSSVAACGGCLPRQFEDQLDADVDD